MKWIHKEGRSLLALVLVIVCLLTLVTGIFTNFQGVIFFSVVCTGILFFGLLLQFFRNPTPKLNLGEDHVLAPAEGKVVVIEETFEPEYLKANCIQISIFMSPFNVHVNRNPISGVLSYFKYHPGKYLVAWHPKSSTENERTTLAITNARNHTILFRQIAGALAKRICWYVKQGDQVQQGAEFGFIKFGSRVDVFLPMGSIVDVQIGQTTKGGETILARLPND